MTPEEQKGIAPRFFEEVWNLQKLDTIDEVFANGKIVEDWSRTSSRSCSSLASLRAEGKTHLLSQALR